MMRERVRQGESAAHAAARLLNIIERKGVRALQDPSGRAAPPHRLGRPRGQSGTAGDAGPPAPLAELSIFPEDVAIPLAAAASVWELDEFDAEDLAQRLARLSLMKLDLERGVLRLHDVMRSWLAGNLGAGREIHNRLVNAWPDWRNLPEMPGEYAWRWLPWHLAQAGRKQEIERILWDPRVDAGQAEGDGRQRLDCGLRTPEAVAESGTGPGRAAALGQCACGGRGAVCLADGGAAAAALWISGDPTVHRRGCRGGAGSWLRPLHPALHPPGTELVRTLEGHTAVCQWRGGDAGREAGGFRVLRQHAEGVGPGDRPGAAHAGRPR